MAHPPHIPRLLRTAVLTVALSLVATLTVMIALSSNPPPAQAQGAVPCLFGGQYPVILPDGTRSTTVTSDFDLPAQNWLPGHRGVDIAAPPESVVVAPTRATVSFAGSVGGKSVVSVTVTSGIVMSFEPVETDLKTGDALEQGERVGTVSGHSDHCDERCVHWGARRNGRYINPLAALNPSPIVLKPISSDAGP